MMLTRHIDTTSFDRQVEAWIVAALQSGVSDFEHLLAALPGVYPTVALGSIEHLHSSGLLTTDMVETFRHEARHRSKTAPSSPSLMPLPHPVEFEWRFTADGARLLLDIAADLAPAGMPVMLFGTPGVAAEALVAPIDRPLIFVGEDNAVTRRISMLAQATNSPLQIKLCAGGVSTESAAVVILDPPWYLDFLRPMLTATAAACQMSGFILISLPAEGTRPCAGDDRMKVFRLAKRLGLELTALYPLALSYETPFFEANALAATGIHLSSAWRRGDLAIFRKVRGHGRVVTTDSVRKARWSEIEIGRLRLFVRRDRADAKGMRGLIPLVDGDILPTVSRRDPRRRRAEIWTSGNRLFASDHPELVVEAALALSGEDKGYSASAPLWATMAERDAIERIGYKLRTLAAREAAEEQAMRRTDRGVVWTLKSTNSWTGSMDIASG